MEGRTPKACQQRYVLVGADPGNIATDPGNCKVSLKRKKFCLSFMVYLKRKTNQIKSNQIGLLYSNEQIKLNKLNTQYHNSIILSYYQLYFKKNNVMCSS